MELLAMVGFAEGVIRTALGLMCIGVALVTLCAALGLLLRSRVAGIAGLLLVLVTAYLFFPWEAFVQEPSDDGDAQELQATYLGLARWWVVASTAAVAGAVRAFWRPWAASAEQTPPAHPTPEVLMKPGKGYLLTFAYPTADEVRAFLETRSDFWAAEPDSGSYSFVLGASDLKSEVPPSWDLFASIDEGGLWIEVMNERGDRILAEFVRVIPEWFGAVTVEEAPEQTADQVAASDRPRE